MKFSAYAAAFDMADLKKIIDISTKLGYDTVGLTAALYLPTEFTPECRKGILGWIHDAGIVCSALHYTFDGTIRLLSTDPEMMNRSTAYLKQVVDVTYGMECPTIIVGSGGKAGGFEPDWDRKAGMKYMAKVIRRVGLYAQEKGVILAIEAINRYKTNSLNTLGGVVNFMNIVNLPNVRTMVDTYHLDIREVNPAEIIRKCGHTLANLRLADLNRQAPGGGHFDFVSVAKAFREADFKGYYSFGVFGLYPWKLWYDTFEESVEHMGDGIKYARSIFGWIMP